MIGIIGAGISGLTLAYQLEKAGKEYILLESSDYPGGLIRTDSHDGHIFEMGPNSLLYDDEILDFLKELGLEDEIMYPEEVSKTRFVLRGDELKALPAGPAQLMTSSFFSLKTRFHILSEAVRTRKELKENETLQELIEERFGKEVADYVLNPFVSGVFAGDPAQLLVKETFPVLEQYLKKYGSILKGFKNEPPGRKGSLNFLNGMASLPKALAEKTSNIRYNAKVEKITKNDSGFSLKIQGEEKLIQVKKLAISAPAYAASTILEELYPDFASYLSAVNYPPMIVVQTLYDKFLVKHELNGFGALHPKVEDKFAAGSIWTSSVFPGRCKKNEVLFTTFVGGSQYVKQAQKDEPFIRNKVQNELGKIYGIKGDYLHQKQYRWEKAIPQYDKNILPVKDMAGKLENENLFICANWLNGVSLSDCIKKAKSLAGRI